MQQGAAAVGVAALRTVLDTTEGQRKMVKKPMVKRLKIEQQELQMKVTELDVLNDDCVISEVLKYFTQQQGKQQFLLPAVCKTIQKACEMPHIKWRRSFIDDSLWRISCHYEIGDRWKWYPCERRGKMLLSYCCASERPPSEHCIKAFFSKLVQLARAHVVEFHIYKQELNLPKSILGFDVLIIKQRAIWCKAMDDLAEHDMFAQEAAGPFRSRQFRPRFTNGVLEDNGGWDSNVKTSCLRRLMLCLGFDYNRITTADFVDPLPNDPTLVNTQKFPYWKTPVCWPEFRYLQSPDSMREYSVYEKNLKFFRTMRSLAEKVALEAAAVGADLSTFYARAAAKKERLMQEAQEACARSSLRSSLRQLPAIPALGTNDPLLFWNNRRTGRRASCKATPRTIWWNLTKTNLGNFVWTKGSISSKWGM
jgi:hypothetical protein